VPAGNSDGRIAPILFSNSSLIIFPACVDIVMLFDRSIAELIIRIQYFLPLPFPARVSNEWKSSVLGAIKLTGIISDTPNNKPMTSSDS
jgi:hypothetical protein